MGSQSFHWEVERAQHVNNKDKNRVEADLTARRVCVVALIRVRRVERWGEQTRSMA